MLDFTTFSYFVVSLFFFLQTLYFGGLTDFMCGPSIFSYSAVFLLVLFARHGASPERRLPLPVTLNLAVYAFTAVISRYPEGSYIEAAKYLSSFFLAFSVASLARSFDEIRDCVKAFMAFVQAYIAMALAFNVFTYLFMGAHYSVINFTLFNPNYYNTFSIVTVPFVVYLFSTSKSRAAAANYALVFVTQCAGVLMTSSRMAQVSLALGVLLSFSAAYALSGKKRGLRVLAAVFAAMALFGALFVTDAFSRIAGTFTPAGNYDVNSESGRMNIYRASLSLIAENPAFGVGPGVPAFWLPKYRVSEFSLTNCHNIVLNVLAEGGIVYFASLALMLASLFYALYAAFKKARRPEAKLLAASCASSLFLIYFQGFSMPHVYLAALVYLEYFIIGACAATISACEDDGNGVVSPNPFDFRAGRAEFYSMALLSALAAFLFCMAFLSEAISNFAYWFVSLTFVFLTAAMMYRGGAFSGVAARIASGPAAFAAKASIAALVAVNLYFVWCFYISGYLCDAGVEEMGRGFDAPAIEYFEKSVAAYPNMAALLHLSALYSGHGMNGRALLSAHYYAMRLPHELVGINNLAACLVRAGASDRAAEALKKLDRYCCRDQGGAFYGAYLISDRGLFDEGLERFAAAAVENPELARSIFAARTFSEPAREKKYFDALLRRAADSAEKYRNFRAMAVQNVSRLSLYLYCRGFLDAARLVGGNFSDGPSLSRAGRNILEGVMKSVRLFFLSKGNIGRAFYLTAKENDRLLTHFALRQWISSRAFMDIYGLRTFTPDIPFPVIYSASFFLNENEIKKQIKSVYYKNIFGESR